MKQSKGGADPISHGDTGPRRPRTGHTGRISHGDHAPPHQATRRIGPQRSLCADLVEPY